MSFSRTYDTGHPPNDKTEKDNVTVIELERANSPDGDRESFETLHHHTPERRLFGRVRHLLFSPKTLDEETATGRISPRRRPLFSTLQGLLVLITLLVCTTLLLILATAELKMALIYNPFPHQWHMSGYNASQAMVTVPHGITRDVTPVRCHSHNDYWRKIPLFEGLHYGCTGTEADVHLVGDELYVGHDQASLKPQNTLKNMYLDPLLAMLDYQNQASQFWNGTGKGIFEVDPEEPLVLLVDLKTDGVATLAAVEKHLEPLRSRGYLRHWNGTALVPGPIIVVGTGNTPFNVIASNSGYRDVFYDAPLADIYQYSVGTWKPHDGDAQGHTGTAGVTPDQYTPENSYYASVRYGASFKYVTERFWFLGKSQIELLGSQIAAAEKQGLKARYWSTPAWPISLRNHVWEVLVSQNTGILNVDDLASAATRPWSKGRHV